MAKGVTSVSVTFNRFPEIAAALPEKTKVVVAKTARDIEADAKNVVPVDTGNLKNSIDVEFENDGLTAIVAPHTEYAVLVEFGTRRMSAQPFMTPAAERNRPAFIAAMKQMLKEVTEREGR
jgi:HK97 gp10 family phage protein